MSRHRYSISNSMKRICRSIGPRSTFFKSTKYFVGFFNAHVTLKTLYFLSLSRCGNISATNPNPQSPSATMSLIHILVYHGTPAACTRCSFNIMFFSKVSKYSGLLPFSVFSRCQCVYTHQAGKKPALQQNWQSSEKSQNFMEKTQ